jgi:hypothetical protein
MTGGPVRSHVFARLDSASKFVRRHSKFPKPRFVIELFFEEERERGMKAKEKLKAETLTS